jgi:lipoprotein-anchoring transpeptidase ErfK/SrfK
MYRRSITARILATLLITALTAVALAFAAAVVDDYARRDILPDRAYVSGVAIAGLPRPAAEAVVKQQVAGVLLSPADVRVLDRSFPLDPSGYATVDVEGMVSDALAPKRQATIVDRVVERIGGPSLGRDVPRKMKLDETKLAAWVADIDPLVATISLETTGLSVVPAADGHRLDTTAAVPALSKALLAGQKSISLPVLNIRPKVTEQSFGKIILVRVKTRKLYLYNGPDLEKTYDVAVGTPGYPTPKGWWTVVNKRYMPSWSNPAPSGWGSGMPAYIGPGPSNPLGTRAIDLDASGIRIHGTTKDGSIGTAASHGCMRMHRWDIEDLFPRVPVGTRVIIVS